MSFHLSGPSMPAQQRIRGLGFECRDAGPPPARTRRWYDLDGRMCWVHPSSLTAWSRKYLPDGSSKSSISAGLDKPDDGRAKWTGWQLPGGHVLAARRPGGPSSLARQREETGPRVDVGGHRGRASLSRRRFAHVLRRLGRAGRSRLCRETPGPPICAGQRDIS